MVPTVPALGGIPAGPELLIIFLVLSLLIVPVIVIVGVVLLLKLRSDDGTTDESGIDADRIAELESEVERLREKVEDEPDERDSDDRL